MDQNRRVEARFLTPPRLTADPTSVSVFAELGDAGPLPDTVHVGNAGETVLKELSATVEYAGGTSGWLTTATEMGDSGGLVVLSVSPRDLLAGTYEAELRLESAAADNSPLSVAVTLEVGLAKPHTVVVVPNDTVINVGDSVQMTATALDSLGGTMEGFTFGWASSEPGVVSVSSTGLAKALATGSGQILASVGDVVGQADLTVSDGHDGVFRIQISPSSVNLTQGESATLAATAFNESGSELPGVSFSWSSLDVSIALVDGEGNVTASKPGSTGIVAQAEGVADTAAISVASLDTLAFGWIPDTTAANGDSVAVPVWLDLSKSGKAVGSFQGSVSFDPTILSFLSVDKGTFEGSYEANTSLANSGTISFAGINVDDTANRGLLKISVISFEVVGKGGGADTIRLRIPELASTDFLNLASGLVVSSGRFVVSTGIWGDVNKDKKITALDALMCLSHVVGKQLPMGSDPGGCDVVPDNGDLFIGKVMAIDALAILSYVVGKVLPETFRVGKSR